MGRRTILLASLALALTLPTIATAAAGPTPISKRRAELNVINATGLLRQLHVPFFDRTRNALPSNTHVACAGRGRAVHHRYLSFVCAVTYRKQSVRLKYIVRRGGHFSLLRLR